MATVGVKGLSALNQSNSPRHMPRHWHAWGTCVIVCEVNWVQHWRSLPS